MVAQAFNPSARGQALLSLFHCLKKRCVYEREIGKRERWGGRERERKDKIQESEVKCSCDEKFNHHPLILVSIVELGNIERIHSQDLSNKKLNEAVIKPPNSSFSNRKTHYCLSPDILEMASKLDSLKDSHVFQDFWHETAELLSNDTLDQDRRELKLSLPDVVDHLYYPCYEKFYKLYMNLRSGEITFADVDVIFRDFKDKYDELNVDLKFMCTLDPQDRKGWISQRVRQIKEYHTLYQAVSSAKVIVQVRRALGVTGDFSVLNPLLNFVSCLLAFKRGKDLPKGGELLA